MGFQSSDAQELLMNLRELNQRLDKLIYILLILCGIGVFGDVIDASTVEKIRLLAPAEISQSQTSETTSPSINR